MKTEVYKQETDRWETLADFPFAKKFTYGRFTNPQSINHYGIASTDSRGSTERYYRYLFTYRYGIFVRSIHKEAFLFLADSMEKSSVMMSFRIPKVDGQKLENLEEATF